MSTGKGEGKKVWVSLFLHSLFLLFKEDPWLPAWLMATILEWPFGTWHHSGLGAGAVRSETAVVPSALQAGSLEVSALPRCKEGAINQPIWELLCCIIHLWSQSLMVKMGQEVLRGRGLKGSTYPGNGRRSCGEAGQGSLLAQWFSNSGSGDAVKKINDQWGHPRCTHFIYIKFYNFLTFTPGSQSPFFGVLATLKGDFQNTAIKTRIAMSAWYKSVFCFPNIIFSLLLTSQGKLKLTDSTLRVC